MSCIRFTTPAQRRQMKAMAPAMLTAGQTEVLHPAPLVTASKITRLRLLATHPNPKIRESVASSYNTPGDLFTAFATDAHEGVRACVARNETAPRDVLRSLVDDPSERVRGFLALNFSVPADTMARLSLDTSETVRSLVQWRTDVATV